MQPRAGTQTGTADVAGIPMDLRGHQHHVAFLVGGFDINVAIYTSNRITPMRV
jgi:hypothetical protein